MNDSKLSKGVTFVYKLIILNFVYFFATVLGLGVAGFFPATLALIKTIPLLKENKEKTLIQQFIRSYKKYFVRANVWGYAGGFLLIGAYINYKLLTTSPFFVFNVLGIVVFLLTGYLLLSVINGLYLKELQEGKTYKQALIEGCIYTFIKIGYSLMQVAVVIAYYFLVSFYPATFLFGGSSLVLFTLYRVLDTSLSKIHQTIIEENF